LPKKVFELAKELNKAPLDLVEDLKLKGFIVRNHMSELSDSDIESYLSLSREIHPGEHIIKKLAVRKKSGNVQFKNVKPENAQKYKNQKADELKIKLGALKEAQDLQRKILIEQLSAKELKPEGRREIRKKYSRKEYSELIQTPSTLILELYDFDETSSYKKLRELECSLISFTEFNEERILQLKDMARTEEPSWALTSAQLAVGGEVFASKWATRNGRSLKEISASDHKAKFDSIIDGKKVDIKTRQQSLIGKKQNDLPAERWDGHEIIMFIQGKAFDYHSAEGTFKLIGIFDGDLISKHGFSRRIESCSFFTAPFFLDARFYFKLDSLSENWPELPREDISFYFEAKEYKKIINRYGGEQYFRELAKYSPKFEKLFLKLSQLYREQVFTLCPLAILDHVLEFLEKNIEITNSDCEFLEQSCINCIEINELQKNYLTALLKVAKEIVHRNCRFTGKPLGKAPAIRLLDGVLHATYSDKKERNTLLAYSRYSGELLVIGEPGVEICQDIGIKNKTCACLVHKPKDRYIGKSGCPEYGWQKDLELRS